MAAVTGSIVDVGGLAAASVLGWLEEVARVQGIEQHYGLSLTATADPGPELVFAVPGGVGPGHRTDVGAG